MLILAACALALWLAVLALPWQPWRCRERIEPRHDRAPPRADFSVLVPARNEAMVLADTLAALAAAAPHAAVFVINDESTDATAEIARASPIAQLAVIAGTPPPPGWTGKLWALQQGLERVTTPWVLLLDADIHIEPGLIADLQRKADAGYALVSVCAEPCWQGWAARWLLPAFIHFFKLLYPFHLVNHGSARFAAAAGGVVLADCAVLRAIGAFTAWRSAIIDDCTLAAHAKRARYRCWIGLTHGARSLRAESLAGIVQMVARTAFVQLRESWWRLCAATALMLLAFALPVACALLAHGVARWLGVLGWAALAIAYLPTLRYYRRHPLAAIVVPAAAIGFLAMTWYAALRALRGTRSVWKDRRYARGAP